MAQKTITANATASLSASGTSTATGSITWTAPSLPEGVTGWDSVHVSGSWSWNGKGNISRVTINNQRTSADSPFDIDISGQTSPLTITCVGNNKNATGANFRWSNLIVTYTYTTVGGTGCMVKLSGTWTEIVEVWKKSNGHWTLQPDAKEALPRAVYRKMN